MNLFSSAPSRILALYTDGITTTGAVFARVKGGAEEHGRATARGADYGAVLADILATLKSSGVKVPKQSVVVSDRSVLSRVELPVHPDRPRPYEQMRELARWESEIAFSDLPSWSAETVLRELGAIGDSADELIRARIEQNTMAAMGGPAPRYQDVALSLDLIDRSTRERAVEMVETLNQPVGEAGCAWAPLRRETSDDLAQHNWLISSTSEPERHGWRAAAAAHKLDLIGILPAWGLSDCHTCPPSADVSGTGGQRLLIERHPGAVALLSLTDMGVESLRVINLNRQDINEADTLRRALEGRETSTVLATGFAGEPLAVIRALFPKAEISDDATSVVLEGAAARVLGVKDTPDWPPIVAPSEPKPPVWKNDNFYRVGLVAMVILAVGATDIMTRMKRARLVATQEQVEAEYENRLEIRNAMVSALNEVKALELGIEEMRSEIDDLTVRNDMAVYLQQQRQDIVVGLLKAVRTAIPKGVVMREIAESRRSPEVFTLSAWALSDIDAETFIARLNEAVGPLGLVVADEAVFEEKGPQDLSGYAAHLRIVPNRHGGDIDPNEVVK